MNMRYAHSPELRQQRVTEFGGPAEEFDDLYWEASLAAKRQSGTGRPLPNLTSQIEEYLRTN